MSGPHKAGEGVWLLGEHCRGGVWPAGGVPGGALAIVDEVVYGCDRDARGWSPYSWNEAETKLCAFLIGNGVGFVGTPLAGAPLARLSHRGGLASASDRRGQLRRRSRSSEGQRDAAAATIGAEQFPCHWSCVRRTVASLPGFDGVTSRRSPSSAHQCRPLSIRVVRRLRWGRTVAVAGRADCVRSARLITMSQGPFWEGLRCG